MLDKSPLIEGAFPNSFNEYLSLKEDFFVSNTIILYSRRIVEIDVLRFDYWKKRKILPVFVYWVRKMLYLNEELNPGLSLFG